MQNRTYEEADVTAETDKPHPVHQRSMQQTAKTCPVRGQDRKLVFEIMIGDANGVKLFLNNLSHAENGGKVLWVPLFPEIQVLLQFKIIIPA